MQDIKDSYYPINYDDIHRLPYIFRNSAFYINWAGGPTFTVYNFTGNPNMGHPYLKNVSDEDMTYLALMNIFVIKDNVIRLPREGTALTNNSIAFKVSLEEKQAILERNLSLL